MPEAVMEVLGRDAPRDLASASGEGFHVLGDAPDTRPYWNRAALAIVPLLAGGGTRLKILEAVASGVPVVSTSVGAEGLDLEAGSEIVIRDDPGEMASEIARLLADPEARRRQAAAARARVEREHGWERIAAAFARELARRRPEE
jgi:glycosyltransferase involved in cell wall biosynthesis